MRVPQLTLRHILEADIYYDVTRHYAPPFFTQINEDIVGASVIMYWSPRLVNRLKNLIIGHQVIRVICPYLGLNHKVWWSFSMLASVGERMKVILRIRVAK